MNTALRKNTLDFNLDQPVSEYGFSTRLENENFWTINFSHAAIIEYKKFMYLAAISDSMVSPSEIVDIVWHQHLIFTESYDSFCAVLGKKIIHIPSTHQKQDFDNFKRAKEKTTALYKENFGEQPNEFWEYPNMLNTLKMQRSRFPELRVLLIGMLLFIPLVFVSYFFLRPIYIKIDTSHFFLFYALIIITSLLSLELYNHTILNKITGKWSNRSFIADLSALELIYLKKSNIQDVIHGVVNQLILDQKISVLPNNKLTVIDRSEIHDSVSLSVLQTISSQGKISYSDLLIELKRKPAFNKTVRAMEGFKNYVKRSKDFIQLFIINFTVLSIVSLLGIVRIATGLFRNKPITIIGLIVIILLLFIAYYLYRLKSLIGPVVIAKLYDKNVISQKPNFDSWEWNYFLLGSTFFVASFEPLVSRANRDNFFIGDSGGDSGGSSSSNCGSSDGCGSSGSCGGCGGD